MHRNQNGIHLDLEEPRSADERRNSSDSEVKTVVRSRNSSIVEEQNGGVNTYVPKENSQLTQSRKPTKSDRHMTDSGSGDYSDINANVGVVNEDGVYIEPIGESSDNAHLEHDHIEDDAYTDHTDGYMSPTRVRGSSLRHDNGELDEDEMKDSGAVSPSKLTPEKSRHVSSDSSAKGQVHNDKGEKRRLSSTNSEPDPDDEAILRSEFQKLRSFAQEVVPKPLYEEAKMTEEVEEEPIEESMEYEIIDHDESQEDLDSRFFTFDKVQEHDNRYPDFSELDYEYHDFGVNEVDPDLLSMNLHPIIEETEEELAEEGEDEDEGVPGESAYDWRGNWMFKG